MEHIALAVNAFDPPTHHDHDHDTYIIYDT